MEEYLNNIFSGIDDNIRLDDEQKRVILDNSKNIMVIAGAGAGKTTVITAKVKYLIEIKKIKPENILIISFTNKAIEELKQRINEDFNLNVDISTFHSFAFNIVKNAENHKEIIVDNKKILTKLIKKNSETKKIMKYISKNRIYKKEEKRYNSPKEYFINFTVENFNLFRMKDLNIKIEDRRICKYVSYLSNILPKYKQYLKEKQKIDFEDMIIRAIDLVSKNNLAYEYIIIDEFQDISLNRYLLIKKITEITDVKTMVVGDDWQAIYSFAGSDNNLFLNYSKDMDAKIYKITKTYRNSQELIDIVGNFVMRNERQIKKNLFSDKKINNPIVIYRIKRDIEKVLCYIIDEIIGEYGLNKNILILGRYKKDIDKVIGNEFSINHENIIYRKEKQLRITYLTIHSSKGLGYDNVILIMPNSKVYGFPNNKNEDPIRKFLLPNEEKIMEERRLFYVALTRTKNKVYIVSNKKNESKFVKEIIKEKNVVVKNMKKHNIK